jgi:hypothetical protein
VFAAAEVGFVRQIQPGAETSSRVGAILGEADPASFAAKYPDSGIVESYGQDQWAGLGCIDYWLYVDAREGVCRLNVEGWNLPEILVRPQDTAEWMGCRLPLSSRGSSAFGGLCRIGRATSRDDLAMGVAVSAPTATPQPTVATSTTIRPR